MKKDQRKAYNLKRDKEEELKNLRVSDFMKPDPNRKRLDDIDLRRSISHKRRRKHADAGRRVLAKS